MWKRILESGKAIALLPSLSLFVGAVFLGFYGIYILIETLYKAFTDELPETAPSWLPSSYR
jgi:hypothetical protein